MEWFLLVIKAKYKLSVYAGYNCFGYVSAILVKDVKKLDSGYY